MLAEAYKQSQTLRGVGDAEAASIYGEAYGKDKEFFSFTRHLEVYKRVLNTDTSLIMQPNSDLLKYLEAPNPANRTR